MKNNESKSFNHSDKSTTKKDHPFAPQTPDTNRPDLGQPTDTPTTSTNIKDQFVNRVASVFALMLASFSAFAQDGELLDIDVSIGEPEWYENPYIWIGGVIILLLVLLLLRRK